MGRTKQSLLKLPTIVLVEWLDACSYSNNSDEDFGVMCFNVGYVTRQDERGITLAAEYSDKYTTFRHFIDIPKCLIRKVHKVDVGRTRK